LPRAHPVVPLGDLLENRGLIFWSLCAAVAALLAAAFAPFGAAFLAAAFLIGLACVAAQIVVPVAAHLSSDSSRGATIGNVMSGLLVGVMLARPVSSLIANAFGWRSVFIASAVSTATLAFTLRSLLPERRPKIDHSYFELIGSLWTLLRDTPLLRRRAAYQAFLFAAFTVFWTAVPLELAGPTFGFSQRGVALFALAGAGGALSAPIAGRLADRGWGQAATGAAMALAAIAFLLARLGGEGSLVALLAAGVILDAGVQGAQIVSLRAIQAISPETRSRLNGLYIAIFFAGGAAGSAVTSLAFATGGWPLVSWIGLAFPLAAAAIYVTEFI
jgi:predicted MFS family arabinose efflux permease